MRLSAGFGLGVPPGPAHGAPTAGGWPLSQQLDMAVRGGLVVLEDAVRRLDIGVADGRIVALAEAGALPQAAAEYEADGFYVLPGGIDSHTHLQWPIPPGEAGLDDFGSGTAAAAVGGTT